VIVWQQGDGSADLAEALSVCADVRCPCEVVRAERLTEDAELRLLWSLGQMGDTAMA
jgi:hypothetical protein